ncbi:DUF1302 domain-containing protein [Venatoribacter cucullus]|nr:DUF1302 domain-containing protein [Venatoribacter cucullus]
MMKKLPLALAVSALSAMPAVAAEFNFGDLSMQIDNNISYGVAWRTEKPDNGQIMPDNIGISGGSTSHGSSYNYDDGTLNYKQGDIYSNVFKWNGDLELSYQNYGAFVRARAWYDTAIMDSKTNFKPIADDARDYAGRNAEILDAFVWGDFTVADRPLNVRLGRQVVNWGESTFIQGGINSVNPVDAMAFRRPGAEVKEGLLPVNMAFASFGLTDSTSLEVFYQLEWAETRVDPCGTFFSTIDFVYEGCGNVVIGSGFNEANVPESLRPASVVTRLDDRKPRDDGQFGIALRSYIGGTEFGAYYMNIHSRMPYISGRVGTYGGIAAQSLLADFAAVPSIAAALNDADFVANLRNPEFQIAYPEDIQIMGLSFSTGLPNGASLGGEISYRPDTPIQWNAFELILGGLQQNSLMYQDRGGDLSLLGLLGGFNDAMTAADPTQARIDTVNGAVGGQILDGWDKLDVWQAQLTYIQFFDRVLGADRLAMVVEGGVTHVADLPSKSKARYGRSGAYGIGDAFADCASTTASTANSNSTYCTDEGYVTEWSGGVRLRAGLDFNNAFAGVNMTPNLSLSYDRGYGPEPGAQFIDERLTYSLGVSFVYLNNASLDVAYTGFSGNRYDQMVDRDNVSLALKYAF